MRSLFYSPKKGYVLVTERDADVRCSHCNKYIGEADKFFLLTVWIKNKGHNKRFSSRSLLCMKDARQFVHGQHTEMVICRRNSRLPPNPRPVSMEPPEYVEGHLSTFDAAISDQGFKSDTSRGVVIKDSTVHAGRESWKAASIGNSRYLIEERDRDDDGLKFLEAELKRSELMDRE